MYQRQVLQADMVAATVLLTAKLALEASIRRNELILVIAFAPECKVASQPQRLFEQTASSMDSMHKGKESIQDMLS